MTHWGKAIAVGLLLAGAAPAGQPPLRDGAGAPAALPRPSILLFWALWCAPCRAETRALPALAEAAGPLPLLVVPLDANRQTRRELAHVDPANIRYVEGDALAFMQGWTGSVGLPASVAIDRDGRRCAVKFGQVTPADLADWRRRCG